MNSTNQLSLQMTTIDCSLSEGMAMIQKIKNVVVGFVHEVYALIL
jgi:hypothetical protein